MSSPADLSIVIPVYNEGDNIRHVLEALVQLFGKQPEILICYDFEEDNTLPEARKYFDRLSIRLVKNPKQGVLSAIQSGFQAAARPAVLVTMADLSDDLACVPLMLDQFEQGASVVCASRYMAGGHQIGGPWLKKNISRLAGLSLRALTGIPTHDITSNFRLYSKHFLESVTIESTGGFEVLRHTASQTRGCFFPIR